MGLLRDQGEEKEDLCPTLVILKLTFQNLKGS